MVHTFKSQILLSHIYAFRPSSSAHGSMYKSPTADTDAFWSSNDLAAYMTRRSVHMYKALKAL